MPAALRTYLLVNPPNASDWTAMRRSIQSYLLATASAPKLVPMDLGKDGKDKGHKPLSRVVARRVTKAAGTTTLLEVKEVKESRKTRVETAKVKAGIKAVETPSTSQDIAGSAACGEHGRRQVNAVEEAAQPPVEEVLHLSATAVEETWIYSVLVADKTKEETPSGGDTPRDGIDRLSSATEARPEEKEDESLNPILVCSDIKAEETPVAEVSTNDEFYEVEAMMDSGAGASVCSPTDFPSVAIDTKTAVTKVYRCADGRELRVYGCNWIHSPGCVATHHRVVVSSTGPTTGRMGLKLKFGGAPVEAAATHRATKRRLALVQRVGLYFIPLMVAAHQTQHVRGHVVFSFEEDIAGDGVERHETAFHESGVDEEMPDGHEPEQQEPAEMKVPGTPTDEERR
eukprot:3057136-Amphidinium_carterae.3